jgi:hypothetical protein
MWEPSAQLLSLLARGAGPAPAWPPGWRSPRAPAVRMVESCRRQDDWDGAWTAGHLAGVISEGYAFLWQLTHMPVSELPLARRWR